MLGVCAAIWISFTGTTIDACKVSAMKDLTQIKTPTCLVYLGGSQTVAISDSCAMVRKRIDDSLEMHKPVKTAS
jgi:hypothetical protein